MYTASPSVSGSGLVVYGDLTFCASGLCSSYIWRPHLPCQVVIPVVYGGHVQHSNLAVQAGVRRPEVLVERVFGEPQLNHSAAAAASRRALRPPTLHKAQAAGRGHLAGRGALSEERRHETRSTVPFRLWKTTILRLHDTASYYIQ